MLPILFSTEERAAPGLEGLLPAGVQTLEEQSRRAYEQYGTQPTDRSFAHFAPAKREGGEQGLRTDVLFSIRT